MKRRSSSATRRAGPNEVNGFARGLAGGITFDEAIGLTWRELELRGLHETHQICALHGSPDVTAEGAAFAATIHPRPEFLADVLPGDDARWKFFIAEDGCIAVRAVRGRDAA